jgi:hypothetical protein
MFIFNINFKLLNIHPALSVLLAAMKDNNVL